MKKKVIYYISINLILLHFYSFLLIDKIKKYEKYKMKIINEVNKICKKIIKPTFYTIILLSVTIDIIDNSYFESTYNYPVFVC